MICFIFYLSFGCFLFHWWIPQGSKIQPKHDHHILSPMSKKPILFVKPFTGMCYGRKSSNSQGKEISVFFFFILLYTYIYPWHGAMNLTVIAYRPVHYQNRIRGFSSEWKIQTNKEKHDTKFNYIYIHTVDFD